MIALHSQLENREEAFNHMFNYLEGYGFALGGNWDYDHGYFDRNLDEAQKVWLRIPFTVTHGTFDGDSAESDAVVLIGKPFVLKHIYQKGDDGDAVPRVTGALVDQFREPVDKDADIEQKWVDRALALLRDVESSISA